MSKQLSIYLDESGDLGFDWLKPSTSNYFVVTLLVCDNRLAIKGIKQAVNRTLKNKLNHKKANRRVITELKGCSTTLAIKTYFFHQLPTTGWHLYSVALNKQRVYPHLRSQTGKKKFYNFLARFLIEKINFPITLKTINLVVDKCKNTEEIRDFNSYLENQLQAALPDLTIRLDINHELSHCTQELQAVDLFCWGIARKNNRNDRKWYEVFKHKIKFETVYFNDNKKDGPFNT